MKYFTWDDEKNRILKETRNISFEEVVLSIEKDQLLDIVEHHDRKKYPGQYLMIVEIRNYAYIVPYLKDEDTFILKTVYPSRKATKKYITKEKE